MTQIDQYNKKIRYLFTQKYIRGKIGSNNIADIPPVCSAKRDASGKMIWRMDLYETPLIFKIVSHDVISEIELLYRFEAEETADGLEIRQYELNLKLWSDKPCFCYRENLDSLHIKGMCDDGDWKRVMVRFHLDQKESNVTLPEPHFHLHFGGDQTPDENCWIPSSIHEPRIPHPPMDIVLLLEYILVNYYPYESQTLRDKREWIEIVRFSQKLFQKKYYSECQNMLEDEDNTLLGHHCVIC
jgi:hypothetical protein